MFHWVFPLCQINLANKRDLSLYSYLPLATLATIDRPFLAANIGSQ